jgi:hypothetical protein
MEIQIKQAPDGGFVWAVLGDDVRVPLGVGRAKSEEQARGDANYAIAIGAVPQARYGAISSAIYPVAEGWRWCIWRAGRPIVGGACDSHKDCELLGFFAQQHTFRPWGDYHYPYRDDFVGGELLDPLAVR